MITLEQGVDLVWDAFDDMVGGEIYVKKIPSMNIGDIIKSVAPDSEIEIIGIRPGEKLHEQMISPEDSLYTYEYDGYYKILPSIHAWSNDPLRIKGGKRVDDDFVYSSDNNSDWMSVSELSSWIEKNKNKIDLP
jgi:FlaA1/EpsC-like NDP-sugar epimerase